MGNWRNKLIVAGVLFVLLIFVFAFRTARIKKEADALQSGKVVTDAEALKKALKEDGVVFAKGEIQGKLRNEDITIHGKKISYDPKERLEGEQPFLRDNYLWVDVAVGTFEYNRDTYKQYARVTHSFFQKNSMKIQADKITILDTEIDIRESPDFINNLMEHKITVREGLIVYNSKLGESIPSDEDPTDAYDYNGYVVKGIYDKRDGVVKLVIKDGKIDPKETKAFSPRAFEEIDEVVRHGGIDYGVEIPAYILVWVLFTLIAWGIMKMFKL